MRYKSPARSSFRDNKTYETLTTRSTYSTVDRGFDGPHCSDDSFDQFSEKKEKKSSDKSKKKDKFDGDRSRVSPSDHRMQSRTDSGYDPRDHNYRYNIIGETQGVTVI